MKSRLFARRLLVAAFLLLGAIVGWRVVLSRSGGAFVKANYTKREYRIPTRDGAKLFTQVYAPRNNSQTRPFLIMRTPFGVAPYGDAAYRRQLGPSESFDQAGYILYSRMFAAATSPTASLWTCARILTIQAPATRTRART